MAEDQQTEPQATASGYTVDAPVEQWPPPPTYVQPAPIPHAEYFPFKPAGGLTTAIVVLLGIMALWGLARIVQPWSTNAYNPIIGIMFVPIGVLFMVWTHRVYSNLNAFGCKGLKSTPVWACVSYIMPIANYWWPASILTEVWRASNPKILDQRSSVWRKSAPGAVVILWWIAFELYANVNYLEMNDAAYNRYQDPLTGRVIGGMCLAAAVLGIIVTRQIADRQNAKWEAVMKAAAGASAVEESR